MSFDQTQSLILEILWHIVYAQQLADTKKNYIFITYTLLLVCTSSPAC